MIVVLLILVVIWGIELWVDRNGPTEWKPDGFPG